MATSSDEGLGADVFEKDEVLETEGRESVSVGGGFEDDIGGLFASEDETFEGLGGGFGSRDRFFVELAGVELVDDVNRLSGDAEVGHEKVEGDELVFLEVGT